MSDADEPTVGPEHDFDDNAHQACYIFRPFDRNDVDDRPAKKRKVKHITATQHSSFPRLYHGDESESQAVRRLEALQNVWAQKQEKIDRLINETDASSLEEITSFAAAATSNSGKDRLRTGLVVSGPDSSLSARLFSKWKDTLADSNSEVLVQLDVSSCPSLQVCLRNIIKNAISDIAGAEVYTAFLAKHKRLVPLNFDLELLQLCVQEYGIRKIMVSLVDVETFDTSILSQILWSLSSWCGRIPFVVLLGIATTVELLESRLPKSTIELLDASVLELRCPEDLLYQIFATIQVDPDNQVFLGPSILAALHELSQSQGTTIASFVNILKVAITSHFFADALAVLACETTIPSADETLLCRTIRNTNSFRDYCEDLLEQGSHQRTNLRSLLNNDSILFSAAAAAVNEGQTNIRSILVLISALRNLHEQLDMKETSPFLFDMELYNCSDDLSNSNTCKEILKQIRKSTSRDLLRVLESLDQASIATLELQPLLKSLQQYQRAHKDHAIRLPDEKSMTSPFATPKSPTKDNIPPVKKQYIAFIDALTAHLGERVQSHSFNFGSFMNESFVINSRQLLLSLATPRPRHVLERALAKPADYLGCECGARNDSMDDDAPNHVPPPTSILYHLLQEAGTIINVRDLFDAFQSRLDPTGPSINAGEIDDDVNGDGDDLRDDATLVSNQRLALCLFYRSLSELKMLGMVKSSMSAMTKKRALASEGGASVVGKSKKAYAEIDFVAKTSWAGL